MVDKWFPTADLEHSGRKYLERKECQNLSYCIGVFAGFIDI